MPWLICGNKFVWDGLTRLQRFGLISFPISPLSHLPRRQTVED